MTDEQIKAVINQISGLAGLDPHYRFAVNMAREVLALRDALAAVCKAAVGVKPDPFPYAYPACAACGAPEDDDGEPRHLPDCPVAAARALLDGGLDTLGPARVRMNMRAAGPLPPSEPREWDWLDDDTDGSKGGSGDDAR